MTEDGTPGDGPGRRGARRALVVEDEALILMSVDAIVAAAGFEVALATTGAAALARIEADGAFDLGVVDLRLPDMWGGEVIRALWARGGAGTPVVVSTGYVDDPPPGALPESPQGPLVLLRKPWTEDEFGSALSQLGLGGPSRAAR